PSVTHDQPPFYGIDADDVTDVGFWSVLAGISDLYRLFFGHGPLDHAGDFLQGIGIQFRWAIVLFFLSFSPQFFLMFRNDHPVTYPQLVVTLQRFPMQHLDSIITEPTFLYQRRCLPGACGTIPQTNSRHEGMR